jgi:hypothetical protein
MKAPFLLLSSFLIALPVLAGEAFVPFVTSDPDGIDSGRSTGADIELCNRGSVTRHYTVRFVPAGATGPAAGVLVQAGTLDPGSFARVSCCESGKASGVLVVSGAPQIAVAADLLELFNHPEPNGVLARLPVLTAQDAVPAGGSALLQQLTWASNGVVTSSLGIFNLGSRPAHCSVSGFGDTAASFSDLRSFLVPAGSTAAFPDVLGQRIGTQGFTSFTVRPAATCDQPFYPFAVQYAGDVEGLLPGIKVVPPSVMLGR